MDFTGVYHKASEQMCYPLNEDELIVNLKTGYDVKRVFIYYGDPFEAGILGGKEQWAGKKEEICFKKHLRHHLWWTTTLTPRFKRCKYYFELHTEEETWYYFENGFLSEEQIGMEGRMLQCFVMPWMNPADVNSTPDWVNDTVWYQIFPDRFCNGTPEKNGADIEKWRTGPVSNAERFGGNLEGIRKKLPYLHDLGISGIYLNPIMEAESTHKYDTRDYTKIDPQFGTNEEFARLVKEAHAHGIRIMVDAVFNHCGRSFGPWADVVEKKSGSPYADWFMIQDWDAFERHGDTRDGRFYSFAFTDRMPKLNTKSYYYEVIYTPYILHGKTCAKDVKIGAGHPYPEKKSTAPVAVTAVTKKIVSKTLPLAEYLEAEETRYAGASPKLGIISFYNGHYALISDCYINKKLVTDQEYAPDGAIAIFNPELAQIETEEAIKTAKHCYLVKYVPGGTMVNEKNGMEHPSIDHNYPVLVVASFAKNQYICLKIEADALQVRKVEQVMSTLGTAVPEQVDFDIPELCNGESVIFELTDSTAAYHVIDSVGDDFYRINAQKFNAELG